MRARPFTRPTLIAAVELLEGHSQARFNQMVLRLGLEEEIGSGTAVSVAKKCDVLGRIAVQRSDQVLGGVGSGGRAGVGNGKVSPFGGNEHGLADPALRRTGLGLSDARFLVRGGLCQGF